MWRPACKGGQLYGPEKVADVTSSRMLMNLAFN